MAESEQQKYHPNQGMAFAKIGDNDTNIVELTYQALLPWTTANMSAC
jgi:hypothetical protein